MSKSRCGLINSLANFFAAAARRVLLPLLGVVMVALLWTSSASCTGRVQTQAVVTYPSLAYVEPGLWVVAESDRPIFYYDNYYWLYQDSIWYRSPYYNRGWVHLGTSPLPPRIRRIRQPRIYRNYRVRPGQRVRRAPTRDYRRRRTTRPPRRKPRRSKRR